MTMTFKLFLQALAKFTAGLAALALLIFLPAGTLSYPYGWLLICLLFVPMFAAGIVMMIRNPELLKKRLNAKEKESEQKIVILLSGIMFLAAFIIAGLNFRFGWIIMPLWSVIAGTVVFVAAYLMYAEVLRENAYLSRVIEVQKNQKVIDTGLYGIVRHPMYCSTVFLFISMGFVLGSPVSVAILLLYIPIIVLRIKNEEQVLEAELEGYADYKKRVKYRLIPFIW